MATREKGSGCLKKAKGCRFWYAQYYKDGRQIRESTRTTVKAEALAVLRRLMGDTARGLLPLTDARKVRYADLRAALLANYVERGNKSLQVLADGSETVWGLSALDTFFGFSTDNPGMAAVGITTDTGREFVRARQAEGVGSAAINRSLALLRRMLRIAFEDGKIQVVPKIRLLKEPPARKGFLAREQFERLSAALPEDLRPLITFLYFCGVRLGEAQQIEWSQVDLAAGLIRLETEQTKTSEARVVPLPDVLIQMLAAMEPKSGAVFSTRNLRKAWVKACAATGLGTLGDGWRYAGLIIHDLRRSAVKNLIAAGVPEKVCMAITGHKTRTVFDRYHIVDTTDVQRAMRRVEENASGENLAHFGVKIGKILPAPHTRKRLTA